MREVAIVSPVRTAVGNFGGGLQDISAAALGTTVIKAVLERTSLDPDKIHIPSNLVVMSRAFHDGLEISMRYPHCVS